MEKLKINEKYYYINKTTINLGRLIKIETDYRGTKYTLTSDSYDITTKRKPNTSIDDLIENAVGEYKEKLLEGKEDYEKSNN